MRALGLSRFPDSTVRHAVIGSALVSMLLLCPMRTAGAEQDPDQTSAPPAASIEIAPVPPLTGEERVRWIVGGIRTGALVSVWQTATNTPEEWQGSWKGRRKRYMDREADAILSNGIEGGLGAIWGEDPRYIRSRRSRVWTRTGYAMKAVFLAPRRGGELAPAWARVAGTVGSNMIENAWLPPSVTTPGQTTLRIASGFAGRLGYNLWCEFWPDLRAQLRRWFKSER